MDPLTIASGCTSLLVTVTKLSVSITTFVRTCRAARSDMNEVKRDLTSLSSVVELIEGDMKEHSQKALPDTLARQINGIVENCDGVLYRISEIVEGRSGMIDAAKWALERKAKVLELRASLRAHTTSLELALELVQLNIARETNKNTHTIMDDTREIKEVTNGIARNTGEIKIDISAVLDELARLRAQVSRQNEHATGQADNLLLERYLSDMTSYAETVNGDIQDFAVAERTSVEAMREASSDEVTVPHEAVSKETGESVETASDLGENNAIDDNNQVVDFNDDLEFQSSYIQDKHRELVLVDGLAQNRVFAPESLPIWKSLSLSRYSQTLPSFDLPRVVEDEASPDATPATDPELEAQNPTKGVAIPSNPTSNGMSNSPEEHLDRPSLEIVPVSNQPPPVGQVGHQIITSTTNETGEETAARRPLISASKKVTTSSQEERGAATKVLSYFKRRSTKDEPHEPLPIQPGYKDISNVVCGHYRVGKKIGERSTSVVFEGVDLSNDRKVFITFEPRKAKEKVLRWEYRNLKELATCSSTPYAYHFGTQGLHNILVTDFLGPTLEEVFDLCSRRFSIKTVVILGKCMLSCVQSLHEHDFILRSGTPYNFRFRAAEPEGTNLVQICNLSRANQYRIKMSHIADRTRTVRSGAPIFMSLETHRGRQQSRRDDLEVLGYMFMYFLRGGLPWQGFKGGTTKKGEKKDSVSLKSLCAGFPAEFEEYLAYARKLGFEDTPDYDYLKDLLSKALIKTGGKDDGQYAWLKSKVWPLPA